MRNLITFSGPQNRAENVAHARIDGVEATWDGSFGEWTAHAAYTWQDARDADADTRLLRRPAHKFAGDLTRAFGSRVRAGVELEASGKRDDVGGAQLGGYALVNLHGQMQLASAWRLDVRLANLTDRDYELVHGYNTPGRSGYVDITWQPAH